MNMQDLESVYSYLEQKKKDYYIARTKSDKESIEKMVRNYAQGMDREIYIFLNENAASGLFRHGFFESDLDHSLTLLQKVLKE